MKLNDYLRHAGISQTLLAAQLGVSQSMIWQWSTGYRPVPPNRCLSIERATGGLVTRGELRPHDGHLIWPDVVQGPVPHSEENPTPFRPSSGADREERSHG